MSKHISMICYEAFFSLFVLLFFCHIFTLRLSETNFTAALRISRNCKLCAQHEMLGISEVFLYDKRVLNYRDDYMFSAKVFVAFAN